MKYLHNRGLADTAGRKVWAFMGDGEMDEPESLGAIGLAAREKLDNLVFVVNCNLQRLDGPVRGNGKIIQELEGGFRGAGWNVIKVIWGSHWDPLLARDRNGTASSSAWSAPSTATTRPTRPDGGSVRARALLRQAHPGAPADGRQHDRRRDLASSTAAATTRRRSTRRTTAPMETDGPAHGDPREDRQGLRDGRSRRGPELHPPAEEDG